MRMNHLKKAILFLGFGITVLICGIGVGTTSNAYTEEEKAAAKAWLSAHGYSPDAGGANQAYQDYLDGKFDEELGVATTEQTTTQNSEQGSTQTSEMDGAGVNPENSTNEINDNNGTSSDSGAKADTPEDTEGEGTEAVTKEEQTIDSDDTMENEEAVPEDENGEQEITLYQKEKKDTYMEAAAVILFSVIILVVIKGIWTLFKK